MAPVHSRVQDHERDYERSKKKLEIARLEASRRNEFTRITGGLAEALLLGLDCSVIAGTGAGKTMPFVMPLLIEPTKRVIIISPLNALEEDQAKRFNAMGLHAVAVNGETWNKDVQKRIGNNEYNVLITLPDMAIEHDSFRSLLSNPKLASKTLCIVVDEAHCISQWGDKFRPIYQQLGTLRAFVPDQVSFLATSATMQPTVLARKLMQTMIFFDDINVSLEALKHLRAQLPPDLGGQIVLYHSRRSSNSRRRVLEEFRSGKIEILLTTEAAGMGCDLPSIRRVVQFMVPKSLAIWIQRAGRAARSLSICGEAFLLVQPTVIQEKKSNESDNGDSMVFKKDVEARLRLWIETTGCRRDVPPNMNSTGFRGRE
ncbi:P-loop containing nucleoside triphosphate hydrolase protein [Lentinula raphanica]|nr:P-loop containing nucleoside triphosphate hydrolase protein [Lentinula raphanica]